MLDNVEKCFEPDIYVHTLRVLSVHRSSEVFAVLGCYAVLKFSGQPIGPTVSGEA